MARTKHALDVTERERDRIRRLFLAGVRITDIVWRTKRSESAVMVTVRGLKRPRPRPRQKPAIAERNKTILAMRRRGMSYGKIAKLLDLSATSVCGIVRLATGKRKPRPVKRTALSKLPPTKAAPPVLTRQQIGQRNRLIERLWREGVGMTRLALRFSISVERVKQILRQRCARPRHQERSGK